MTAENRTNAVLRFEPDGYDISRPWLMGRQVAGHGFLRGMVSERGPGPLYCYTPHQRSAGIFENMVRSLDASAECRWLKAPQLQRISDAGGVLYLADPTLPEFSRARLRVGLKAYSLCGVTHTTASPSIMHTIADLLSSPIAPWDALICTSTAVAETVRQVHEAQAEFLRWHHGPGARVASLQLPIIPLGVHCDDFKYSETDRLSARETLGIGPGEIVALFLGRFTFTGKHHPLAMYTGLSAAARSTGKPVVLLQCGWAPNEAIEEAFRASPATYCPEVRAITTDGRQADQRNLAWAAADLFISLSDGIQETFGLTPLEAMAAGLPLVVSDWNGYRDTVRDGVDGFCIRSWAPQAGVAGQAIVSELETGTLNYDEFLWAAAASTSVDHRQLALALSQLISSSELRRKMGEAGRRRARELYDWRHIVREYQALWADLNERRANAGSDAPEAAWLASAPRSSPGGMDPFRAFGHYPTSTIGHNTTVELSGSDPHADYTARRKDVLFSGIRLPNQMAFSILDRLHAGPASVEDLARIINIRPASAAYLVGLLAKMEVVRLADYSTGQQDHDGSVPPRAR